MFYYKNRISPTSASAAKSVITHRRSSMHFGICRFCSERLLYRSRLASAEITMGRVTILCTRMRTTTISWLTYSRRISSCIFAARKRRHVVKRYRARDFLNASPHMSAAISESKLRHSRLPAAPRTLAALRAGTFTPRCVPYRRSYAASARPLWVVISLALIVPVHQYSEIC